MPGLDGLETLGRISDIRPGIKVVMLSCVSDPQTVVKAIHLGARDDLAKPFQKEDLDVVMRRALGHSDPAPEAGGIRRSSRKRWVTTTTSWLPATPCVSFGVKLQ